MPQLKPKDGKNPVQTQVIENKKLKERLRTRYKPNEYVKVINIDDTPVIWQYFPEDGEETMFTEDGLMRQVYGRQYFDKERTQLLPGNDQVWMLNPGETETLLGANADLFIEQVYKTVVAKKTINRFKDVKEGQARKFNWNDGKLQEELIDQIFLGIQEPEFSKA